MAKSLLSFLNPLKQLRSYVDREIQRAVRTIIRQAMLGLMAGAFLVLSSVFISMGLVEGLSLIVARWAAYFIVGLLLAVIGLIVVVLGFMKRQS